MIFKFARLLSRTVHGLADSRMELKTIAFIFLASFLWLYLKFSLFLTIFAVFTVYVVTGGWRFVRIIIRTAPRDFRALYFLIHAKRKMAYYQKTGANVMTLFAEQVRKHPNKLAFIMVDGPQYTFRDVDEYSNAVANYLYECGYRKDDTIALFMESSPEYVCLWLGMAKIGVKPALINFNLRLESLAHCIKISEAKAIIYGTELAEAIDEASNMLPKTAQLYSFGDTKCKVIPGNIHMNPMIQRSSKLDPPVMHNTKFNETLFYIYTSGTTGLPKAAIVIHSRFFYMSYSVHNFFKMDDNSVIYDTLPLYHTAGGVLGVGQALIKGCTVVIRKKFSASRFWDDCVKYNCTVAQYIGEICRYLLAQPAKPVDTHHRVRIAFGNGLRPQIWKAFMSRFGITRIGEFYGATEGNANIINTDNKVGAVGFNTRIAPALYPVTLVKVDESGELIRDRNGVCIKCGPGEPGELVGKIVKGDPLREFDGYVNKDATSKKIANDVFKKGDTAFLTGDVLEMDDDGYMYFRDRTGDTFRWRGENVSTSEVEATVSNIIHLNCAVAYGVEVPGLEGRAGMVAILDEERKMDLDQLYKDLCHHLPPYARPVFIRLLSKIDTTGTFKLRKVDYKKDGFNPRSNNSDHFYFLDTKSGGYKPIDDQVFNDICTGKVRL